TGETIDSALALLQASALADQLEPATDFRQAVALAERLRLAAVPGDERGCQGNAARCAVELALLDAYGKHFGRPVGDVVSLLAPELDRPPQRVRYSGAVTSARGFKLRLVGLAYRVFCFAQIKVKVGMAGYDDAGRLRVLRRWLRRSVDLRVD